MEAQEEARAARGLVEVLADAHAAYRGALDDALRVLRDGAEARAVMDVATRILQTLTIAHSLHELDEEQSVFPALRAYGPRDEVEAALAYLVEEHIAFDELCERLTLRWEHVASAPACLGPLRSELLAMTEKLSRDLRRHLEHEELVVFPLVQTYVPAEVQARELAVIVHRDVASSYVRHSS